MRGSVGRRAEDDSCGRARSSSSQCRPPPSQTGRVLEVEHRRPPQDLAQAFSRAMEAHGQSGPSSDEDLWSASEV